MRLGHAVMAGFLLSFPLATPGAAAPTPVPAIEAPVAAKRPSFPGVPAPAEPLAAPLVAALGQTTQIVLNGAA